MNESFTKEQVLNAYNIAPDFVRAAFNDEKTTQIIVGLQAKFQLHIDQAGMLGKEVGYLLLGLVDPSKFAGRLKNNGLSEKTANEIVAEINQKIFVPLREQMRSGGEQVRPAMPPSRPQAPMPRPVNAPVPSYAPPRSVLKTITNPVNDEKLLEDHEESHINIKGGGLSDALRSAGVLPPGARFSPRPAVAFGEGGPRPAAVSAGGLRLVDVPRSSPSPSSPLPPKPVPPAPSAPRAPSPPLPISRYSNDPYREPIDTP